MTDETGSSSEGGESGDGEKERAQRERAFNDLTASEWTRLSRNVWRDLSSTREDYHRDHGATFPEALATRVVRLYSGAGDRVLDPFVGTGTTVVAAKKLGRSGTGIDLVEEFVDVAREQLDRTPSPSDEPDGVAHRIVHDDCLNVRDHVDDGSVQVTVTSPPYANLIHIARADRERRQYSIIDEENNSTSSTYSDRAGDFGNMAYDEYVENVERLMGELHAVTAPGGYNVWIVKDFRDVDDDAPYVPLHSDVARAGERAGFDYHDLIVWDQNQHRRLVLNGFPSVFYTNLNSSFVVVLRKPSE